MDQVFFKKNLKLQYLLGVLWVRDDPKLLCDSGEVPISKQSGWRFDFRCEIFYVLDKNNLLGR